MPLANPAVVFEYDTDGKFVPIVPVGVYGGRLEVPSVVVWLPPLEPTELPENPVAAELMRPAP